MTTTDPKLQPLHKTLHALKEIKVSLMPFLKLLQDDHDAKKTIADDDRKKKQTTTQKKKQLLTPHRRAEAEAAVALSIGTLRYMGARLKGLDRGRKKGDELRKELDQIRGLLVSLRKIEGEVEKKKSNNDSSAKGEQFKTTTTESAADNNSNNKSKRNLEEAADADSSSKKMRKTAP
jgi:hypothetical protein